MFSDSERLIYRYFDGERDRLVDPLALEADYLDATSGLNIRGLNAQLKSENRRARVHASAKLVPAIRRAFGVVEFDEGTGRGLPLADTHDLLRSYFAWRGRVRRKYWGDARTVGVFGFVPGRPVTYEFYCGLAFNREAVAAIQAVQTARGIVAALSGSAHPTVIEAMAERESQTESIAETVEAERIESEAQSHMSRGTLG